MRLRDHPSIVIWPPKWTELGGTETLPSHQEELPILKEVKLFSPPHQGDYHGYITIFAEYRQTTYTNLITIIRDLEFLDFFYQRLKDSIGQTIRKIGDAEI